jgi:hypothetical protein
MTFQKIRFPLAAGILAVMVSACEGLPEQAPADITESVEQPVAAYQFGTWNAWTMPVDVCFTKNTDPKCNCPTPTTCTTCTPTDTQYTDLKALAMTGLQESWGLVPGISFVNRGECTSSMTSYLHIKIAWGPGWGGACGVGVGTTCGLGGGTANDNDKKFYKAIIGHEVGHGLGLAHEHQRVDADNCNKNIVDACNRCKTAFDAGKTCTAADWNLCASPNPAVTTAVYYAPGSDQYGKIGEMLGNNAPVSTLERLTPYDPISIMNYCAGKNGRDGLDDRPTAWDLLGMEMIYPLNTTYRIGCKSGCFVTGTGAITRTDGSVTTAWMERGALSITMIDPKTGQNVTSLSTSAIAAGSTQLTFTFKAPRTNTSLTTSGTLVNDNAAHTSLVNAIVAANL